MTSEEIMKPTEVVNEELETLDMDESTSSLTQESPEALDEPFMIPGAEDFTIQTEEKEENSNPFTTVTSIPESNIITPASTSTIIPQNDFIGNKEENKFFTFNSDEPIDTTPNFIESNSIEGNKNNFEIFNAGDSQTVFPELSEQNPFFNNEPKVEKKTFFDIDDSLNTDFDRNPNNKFFTPVYDNKDSEVEFTKPQEKIVNPMDAVNKLMPDYQEQEDEEGGNDLKIAIATIRSCIENLGEKGFYINVEEIDFENTYQITISIKKDK